MRFKRRYRVRVLDAESTAVIWETGYTVLHGRLTALLAPHLQDGYTLAEIRARLNGTLNVLDIDYGLAELARLGYLEDEGSKEVRPRTDTGRKKREPGPQGLVRGCVDRENERVRVAAMGVDPAPFENLLRAEGVIVGDDGDLWVAVASHYLHPGLDAFNREALSRGVPWLLVKPAGELPSFGPVFRPFETACWECFAARRREMPAYRLLGGPPVFEEINPPAAAAVMAMAADAVLNGSSVRELVTVDAATGSLEKHAVVRRQYCPACGEPAPAEARPVVLNGAQPTPATYDHHISPVSGIVASLTRTGDNVFTAVNNFALTSGRSPLRGMTSAGKGLTEEQARSSALCEALERYSGCYRGNEPLVTSSFEDLRGAIHPNACMLFSDAQYRDREAWNRREGSYNWVPQPFDKSRAIEWAPVWSMTHQQFRFLPAAYCYYNYTLPEEHDFCRADSNGNAAGASLEEAILHGFYEVVERDAVALWWYNRVPRPAVVIDLEAVSGLRERMAQAGWKVWAIDLTTDFEIPVFAAMAQRTGGSDAPAPLGFGAHLDPRIALGRAFAEASQGISLMADGRPPRVSIGADPEGAYLWPAGPPRESARYAGGGNPLDDLRTCVARAAQLGLETLVLDQTRADVGVSVVKVIVPGMRHFWARFGPGRLYQSGTPESEMNPAHLVI